MVVDLLEIFSLASRHPCTRASAAAVTAGPTTFGGPSTRIVRSPTNCRIIAIGAARCTPSRTWYSRACTPWLALPQPGTMPLVGMMALLKFQFIVTSRGLKYDAMHM
eukprot:835619-Pyramimonas_sp.AAC.1